MCVALCNKAPPAVFPGADTVLNDEAQSLTAQLTGHENTGMQPSDGSSVTGLDMISPAVEELGDIEDGNCSWSLMNTLIKALLTRRSSELRHSWITLHVQYFIKKQHFIH